MSDQERGLSKKHKPWKHCEPNESNPNSHREYFRLKSAAEQFTAAKQSMFEESTLNNHELREGLKGLSCKKSDKSQATTLKQVFVGKYVCVCECLSIVKIQKLNGSHSTFCNIAVL